MDYTNRLLRQSDDWAATWSVSKGIPRETSYQFPSKILRFKDRLYVVSRDNISGQCCVWFSPPATGDAPFTWTKVFSGRTQTPPTLGANFDCDDTYLYLGEYGDPAGGPNIYRSTDGTTWETTFTGSDQIAAMGTTARHVHAVTPDPYNAGHVYMAAGDFGPAGGIALWRSTAYGATGTWEVAVRTGTWQSVQISFDPEWIWLAADNHLSTVSVVDRATFTPRNASTNWHHEIPVPNGATGDAYMINAMYGAVDVASGVYYCSAATGNYGNTQGLFALSGVGDSLRLIDPGGQGIQMDSEVFIANGRVWCGQWHRPLETAAPAARVPDAPAAPRATAGDARVQLAWDVPGDGGSPITNYRIYRGLQSGQETAIAIVGNVLTYDDTSVGNGTTYHYRISAINTVGESLLSPETLATPQAAAATQPSAPQNLNAKSGKGKQSGVWLTWAAPQTSGSSPVTGYRVHRSTTPGAETLLIALGNVLQYKDRSTTSGVRYYYVLTAVNAAGEGPASSESSAVAS